VRIAEICSRRAPVMERLDQQDELLGLVRALVQDDELPCLDRLRQEPLPQGRVLVGSPFQLIKVRGVLRVVGPRGSIAAPRYVRPIRPDDVVEDRQDVSIGRNRAAGHRELFRRQTTGRRDELLVRPGVVPERLQHDLVHP
jgi:hypothetical protein